MRAPDQQAPFRFEFDAAGVLSVRIDADGKERAYVVMPDPEAEGWGVLFKRAGKDAPPYRVGKPPGRLWECTCYYAGHAAKYHSRSCKHVVAARQLRAMLNHLRPQETLAMPKTPDEPKSVTPAGARGAMTAEQLDLVKRMICKDATDDELKLFLHYCNRTGLDPLAKQIYAIRKQGKMVIVTGIDGYRLIADRTGCYAGNDEPVFDDEKTHQKATVTVWKMVGGVRCPFTASARWPQYCPGVGQDFMWKKMPHLMLGKVAEALALRKAFPAELSGVYAEEEMHQAQEPAAAEATATVVVNGRHVAGPPPTAPAPQQTQAEQPADAPVVAFHRRLQEYDSRLAEQGLCEAGELVKYVAAEGKKRQYPQDMTAWGATQIAVARELTKEFEKARRELSLKQTA